MAKKYENEFKVMIYR